ncbi:unnamed protein product [Lampetra planeri]
MRNPSGSGEARASVDLATTQTHDDDTADGGYTRQTGRRVMVVVVMMMMSHRHNDIVGVFPSSPLLASARRPIADPTLQTQWQCLCSGVHTGPSS